MFKAGNAPFLYRNLPKIRMVMIDLLFMIGKAAYQFHVPGFLVFKFRVGNHTLYPESFWCLPVFWITWNNVKYNPT